MKKAISTGMTGLDGTYLAHRLLDQGYTVTGTYRRTSSVKIWCIEALGIASHQQLHLVDHDVTDPDSCITLVARVKPDEIYNLDAQRHWGFARDYVLGMQMMMQVHDLEWSSRGTDESEVDTASGRKVVCVMMVEADLQRNSQGLPY